MTLSGSRPASKWAFAIFRANAPASERVMCHLCSGRKPLESDDQGLRNFWVACGVIGRSREAGVTTGTPARS